LSERTSIVTIRLSKRNLQRVETLRTLENVDRSTLIKEFIEDGLRQRTATLYEKGKITAGKGAEILGISLREFLELLEQKCMVVNWDSETLKTQMQQKYGK
jgi:predicted HTH domain antitoxin